MRSLTDLFPVGTVHAI